MSEQPETNGDAAPAASGPFESFDPQSGDPQSGDRQSGDRQPGDAPARGSRGVSRRRLLGSGLAAAAAVRAAGLIGPAAAGAGAYAASGVPTFPALTQRRKGLAYQVRERAAREHLQAPLAAHPTNGDESQVLDRVACYSKGLPHNAFGEVDPNAYDAFLHAASVGTFEAFEAVPSGEPVFVQRRLQANPLAGVAFDLEGGDGFDFSMPPAPAFSSAEEAGEIVENYWMALLRDVPFTDYVTSPLAQQACADLSSMSDFRGPKVGAAVTPATLFREDLFGALPGPFVSQFFLKPHPFGAQYVDARIYTSLPGIDFLTTPAQWLAAQNGSMPTSSMIHDPTLRLMRNGRDLSEWVHMDVLYQAYFQAALDLAAGPNPLHPAGLAGLDAEYNPGNPYLNALKQEGFATFGDPHVFALLAEVSTRALKAVWHQKWFVHRRLRPEAFAGRIHHKIVNGRPYPIHADALNSVAAASVFTMHGSYLLPQAFPEGSPMHPSYGAGHATVAGACVTILKALFDTAVPYSSPVVPNTSGTALTPYTGADAGLMTIEGELNKLAHNVAYGRNIAGVHWRSDGLQSLRLGEHVALALLRDQRETFGEPFAGLTLRLFDGTFVTV